MFNIKFPLQIRMGMAVAFAIAEEIQTNLRWGGPFGCTKKSSSRPVLLSIRPAGGKYAFHFEGGVVVSPYLVDVNSFPGYSTGEGRKFQDWVVLSIDVRYYNLDTVGNAVGEKVSETWGSKKLLQLKEKRWWYHPKVQDIATITGIVAIFWNNAASDGYTEVDPLSLLEGNYIVQKEFSYARLIPGDLERAKQEAESHLAGYYTK